MDEKQRSVLLSEEGYEACEDVLQVGAGASGCGVPVRVSCEDMLEVGAGAGG